MRILNFLAIFKLKFQSGKKFYRIKYFKSFDKTICLLINLNLIKKLKINSQFVYVWPNLIIKTQLNSIKIMYNLSWKKTLSIRTIKKMKHKFYPKTLILSTNKGFLTINQALNSKVGGIIFLKIH